MNMVKLARISAIFLIILGLILPVVYHHPVRAAPADCYWVGGTGTWSDDDNHWATSSGGSPSDGNIPDASSDVHFDANSFSGTGQVVTAYTGECHDMDWTGALYNPSVYVVGSGVHLDIYGDVTLIAGMNFTGTSSQSPNWDLVGSDNCDFTSDGTNFYAAYGLAGIRVRKGAGATVNFTDNITGSSTIIYVDGYYGTGATINFQGTTYNVGGLSNINGGVAGAPLYEVDLGTATYNLSTYTLGDSNFVIDALSAIINATSSFSDDSHSYDTVTLTGNTLYLNNSSNPGGTEIADLTISGGGTLTLYSKTNIVTVTNSLTLAGTSTTSRLFVKANTPASYTNIICNGTITASNVDFIDIQGTGSASWNLSAITGGSGNAGHNSGITFTTPVDRYWVDNSGLWSDTTHWSATSGGSSGASVPLVQDTAIFDANSITIDSRVIQLDMPRIGNIDCEDVDRYPQFDGDGAGGGTVYLYGDVVLGDVNWTPANTYFYGRGTQSVWSNGNQIDSTVYLYNYDAVWHIEDDAIITGTLYHRAGTLNMQGLQLTCNAFNSATTTYTRSIAWQGGEVYLTYASPSWNVASTNLTIGVNTGDIKFSPVSGNATFTSGSFTTYNNIYIQGSTNYSTTLSGNFTCNNFIVLRDEAAKTITGNYTITMNGGFYCPVSGTTVVTITNTDFSKASGIVSTNYLSLTGSAASGGASFYAGLNSTNGGGNSGWIFDGPTPPSVTTSAVSGATRDSAYFNAHVVTLGSWTEVLLFYQYNNSGNWTLDYDETDPELVTVQGDYEKFVEDLTPLSHYYVRAVINFNEYDYVYGSNVEFYTTGQPVVVTGSASNITTISATLNGTLTSMGEFASCGVYFKYGLVELALDQSTAPENKTATGTFSAQVLDLKAGYTYYFAAYVNYGSGSTAYGTTEEFDTMAAHKPTTPTAKSTSDIVIGDLYGNYVEQLGPVINDSLDAGGSLFGADGKGFGGFLCFLLFLAIMIPLSAKGYPIAGLGFGFAGAILLGAGIGLIDWALVGVIVFLAALIWVVKHWLRW